jgi:hypothetical protein
MARFSLLVSHILIITNARFVAHRAASSLMNIVSCWCTHNGSFALLISSLRSDQVTSPCPARQGRLRLTYGIRGFAAKASVEAIKSVSALSLPYNPFIEEDKEISIDGSFVEAKF